LTGFRVVFRFGAAGTGGGVARTNGGFWSVTPGSIGITTIGPTDGGGMKGVVSPPLSLPASALPTEPAPGPIAARIGSDDVAAMNRTMNV